MFQVQEAIEKWSPREVEKLFRKKRNFHTLLLTNCEMIVEALQGEHMMPIHFAALIHRQEIVDCLLDLGSNICVKTSSGKTLLHLEALNLQCDPIFLDVLMKSGAQVSGRDANGKTPIHLAAQEGNGYFMDFVLDNGYYHGLRDRQKNSPLDLAIANDRTYVIKQLEEFIEEHPEVEDIDSDDSNADEPVQPNNNDDKANATTPKKNVFARQRLRNSKRRRKQREKIASGASDASLSIQEHAGGSGTESQGLFSSTEVVFADVY